jgi:hypothetical protein
LLRSIACKRYPQRFLRSWEAEQSLKDAKLAEVEFLDEIQTKVLGVFLLAIHNHLYSSD